MCDYVYISTINNITDVNIIYYFMHVFEYT